MSDERTKLSNINLREIMEHLPVAFQDQIDDFCDEIDELAATAKNGSAMARLGARCEEKRKRMRCSQGRTYVVASVSADTDDFLRARVHV